MPDAESRLGGGGLFPSSKKGSGRSLFLVNGTVTEPGELPENSFIAMTDYGYSFNSGRAN